MRRHNIVVDKLPADRWPPGNMASHDIGCELRQGVGPPG